MKTIIQTDYSGIDGLSIVDRSAPAVTPITALVETKFTPVLPYDILTEEGQLKVMRPVSLPLTVSYGFTGIVTKVGALRSSDLVGQAVMGASPSGSARELIANQIPPMLFKIPDNVALDDSATLIGGADAALMATRHINVTATDVILVTGAAGGVGSYLIQLLKRQGAQVIALTSPDNMEFVKELGVDYIIDYTVSLDEQLTSLPRPAKIIDTVGSLKLLTELSSILGDFELLSLSTQSFPRGKPGQTFTFSNNSIGISGYRELLTMLSNGELTAHIQSILPYTEVREAQLLVKNGHAHGRVLLQY